MATEFNIELFKLDSYKQTKFVWRSLVLLLRTCLDADGYSLPKVICSDNEWKRRTKKNVKRHPTNNQY